MLLVFTAWQTSLFFPRLLADNSCNRKKVIPIGKDPYLVKWYSLVGVKWRQAVHFSGNQGFLCKQPEKASSWQQIASSLAASGWCSTGVSWLQLLLSTGSDTWKQLHAVIFSELERGNSERHSRQRWCPNVWRKRASYGDWTFCNLVCCEDCWFTDFYYFNMSL